MVKSMNYSQLIAKAQPLVRDCQVFVAATDGDDVLAYVNENEAIRFVVKHDSQWMSLRESKDFEFFFEPIDLAPLDLDRYIGLTSKSVKVHPNFEQLLHFGDEEIQGFVKQHDADPNDLFDLQSIEDEGYIDFWMGQHPMYNPDGIYAFGGGWAMIWPEDDAPLQWNEELVFLYQIGLENEPFVEVFFNRQDQKFICIERNT